MSVEKHLKSLQMTEMLHCEGCGGYHPVEDCEVVIIKIIKGKGCQMVAPKTQPFSGYFPEEKEKEVKEPEKTKVAVGNAEQMDADGIGRHIPPAEVEAKIAEMKTKKSLIPPGIMAMMIPPGDPNFETKGAKERRIA